MRALDRKININIFIFNLSIIVFMISLVLETSAWAVRPDNTLNYFALMLKLARYSSYVLAIFVIWHKQVYWRKDLIACLIIMAIIIISTLSSGNKTNFLYLFIWIAALGINSRYLIKNIFAAQLFASLIVLFSVMFGLSENYFFKDGNRIRYFLGFNYATILPSLYFFLILQYIYLKKGYLTFKNYIIFMSIAFGLFWATRSRMDFILTAGVLTLFLFYKKFFMKGRFLKNLKWLVVLSPFLITVLSIWLAAQYDSSKGLWVGLNSLLNGRLSLSQEELNNYGINLFGKEIVWVANGLYAMRYGYRDTYNYVDNSYLKILFDFGIIFSLLILFAYAFLLKKSIERESFYLTWIILFILILSMTESWLIDYGKNPFLLLCATEWESMSSIATFYKDD